MDIYMGRFIEKKRKASPCGKMTSAEPRQAENRFLVKFNKPKKGHSDE
jgi:hypothetical protein